MTEREPDPDPIHSLLNSLVEEPHAATAPTAAAGNGLTNVDVPDGFSTITDDHTLSCCCSNPACVALKHNQTAVDALVRDVCVAGKLGQPALHRPEMAVMEPPEMDKLKQASSLTFPLQALLLRHESYVNDSERERAVMVEKIASLESEKVILEQRNSSIVRENRELLDQLESLNDAIAESDKQVGDLQTTLQSSQQEMHRLSHLASRTSRLEAQIADFERDQALWHSNLAEKDESERAALRRWQQAERSLAEIQRQIELIEAEAREERERHTEVLARMERRHAVEKELNSSAARLKGAAGAKSAQSTPQNTNVVSHFVRDLLQDNTTLQTGILELREMLENSNLQVEELRKQLASPPPTRRGGEDEPHTLPQRPHLKEEMRRATAQEVHVHHHYHTNSTPKAAAVRRPRRKRYGSLMSGQLTASGASTPRSSVSYSNSSSNATILRQTAASLPGSYQNTHAFSGPSSPQSTNRASSIFDHVFSDGGFDSSPPTTPGTEAPSSPLFFPTHSKRSSTSSFHYRGKSSGHRSRLSLDAIMDVSAETLDGLDLDPPTEAAIPEEDLSWENSSSTPAEEEEESSMTSTLSEELDLAIMRTPRLRRANSHDSLLSISGMDIHSLKPRPSKLLRSHGSRSFTSQAVLSETLVHADRPAATMSLSTKASRSILHDVAAERLQPSSGSGRLGSRIGWVFGKWGATPATSPDSTGVQRDRTPRVASGSDSKSVEEAQKTPRPTPPTAPRLRSFGVNQSGPIPFFPPEVKLPPRPPVVNILDHDGLRLVLENG